jgi:hypothetical protein
VGGTVSSDECASGGQQANNGRTTRRAPSTTIGKFGPDRMSGSLWSKDLCDIKISKAQCLDAGIEKSRTQRGMQTAKKPTMVKNKITPSNKGNHRAQKTLKAAQPNTVAMVSKEPCLRYSSTPS